MVVSSSSVFILALSGLLAYCIGTLPIGRVVGAKVRVCCFSGREFSRAAALAKVLTDQLKGFLVVYLTCVYVGKDAAQVAAIAVYLGHVYPWIGVWQGSNGVGTLLGAVAALEPVMGLVALVTWLFTYFVFRLATLAMCMATVAPIVVVATGTPNDSIAILATLAVLQLWRHRRRLRNLALDEEPMVDWSRHTRAHSIRQQT